MMLEEGDAQHHCENLKAALRRARAELLDEQVLRDAAEIEVLFFTDNCLLVLPVETEFMESESQLGMMFLVAGAFMLTMSRAGYFMRGSIVRGRVHADAKFGYAFGPGLIEAIELEKATKQPRIEVSEAVVELAQEHARFYASESPQGTAIASDGDTHYVNYLTIVPEEADEDSLAEQLALLAQHRDAIAGGLADAASEEIAKKYHWLADYHDAFCDAAYPSHPGLRVPFSRGTSALQWSATTRILGALGEAMKARAPIRRRKYTFTLLRDEK